MKRKTRTLVLVLAAMALIISLSACSSGPAKVAGSAGLEYTLSEDGTYYIFTGLGSCKDETVTVGNYYNDKPVREMGESALGEEEGIKTLIVSEGITTLQFRWGRQFYIERIELPDGIENFPYGSLIRSSQLKTIVLGKGLKTIEGGSFTGADALTDIYFRGTEAEWNSITIDETDNGPLLAATIHYNYKG